MQESQDQTECETIKILMVYDDETQKNLEDCSFKNDHEEILENKPDTYTKVTSDKAEMMDIKSSNKSKYFFL